MSDSIAPKNSSQQELIDLHQSLIEGFAISDLKLLCFNLGVDFEDIPGETRQDKARELIQYMNRHGRLPELETAIETWPFTKGAVGDFIGPLASRDRSLGNLLQLVNTLWIEGVLNQSLQTAVLLQLDLTYAPHAITRSQPYVLRQADQADTPVPVEQSIIELFETHGRNLLILGDPGSGKTFTMLQLTQALVQQAKVDSRLPVPVVLNLASWADEREPLIDWIVAQMLLQYQTPRKVSRAWLEQNALLLLLDGLDEVSEAHRDACIASINNFKANHETDMVVCSRIADYERLQERLNLSTAVTIQPLTEAEIDRYLSQEELELQAVRATLKNDLDLQELTQSPLMLTIMTLAYHGLSVEALRPLQSIAARRQHLFTEYVSRVFERRPLAEDTPYDKPQALRWLVNLAGKMQRESESFFFIERLQPTWLDSYRPYMVLVGLLSGLLGGLSVGLIFGLIFGLLGGLLGGLLVGLSGGVSGIIGANIENNWLRFIATVLIVGPIVGLSGWEIVDNTTILIAGPIVGPIIGLIIGIVMFNRAIGSVDVLTFSFPSVRHLIVGFGRGFLVGLFGGLSIELSIGLLGGVGLMLSAEEIVSMIVSMNSSPIFWLSFGLGGGLIGAATTFIQAHQIEKRPQPNQGIRSSIQWSWPHEM